MEGTLIANSFYVEESSRNQLKWYQYHNKIYFVIFQEWNGLPKVGKYEFGLCAVTSFVVSFCFGAVWPVALVQIEFGNYFVSIFNYFIIFINNWWTLCWWLCFKFLCFIFYTFVFNIFQCGFLHCCLEDVSKFGKKFSESIEQK
jgi:hypothetical protein